MSDLKQRIEHSWDSGQIDAEAVDQALRMLDTGQARVAEKVGGAWVVHEWLKLAILLYFRQSPMREGSWGDYHWHDKIPLKTDLARQNVRVVPPGTVRYGAFLEPGCVVMPG